MSLEGIPCQFSKKVGPNSGESALMNATYWKCVPSRVKLRIERLRLCRHNKIGLNKLARPQHSRTIVFMHWQVPSSYPLRLLLFPTTTNAKAALYAAGQERHAK